jgi:hypothetical protein
MPQQGDPTPTTLGPYPSYVTADSSVNRKVAFASVGSALGSVMSVFVSSSLMSLPWIRDMSAEDIGALKSSLASGLTAVVTLLVGYHTRPGVSDGVVEEQNAERRKEQ